MSGNSINRGWQLETTTFQGQEISTPRAAVDGQGQAARDMAQTFANLASMGKDMAEQSARRRGLEAGLRDGTAGTPQAVQADTIAGEAYLAGQRAALEPRLELRARARLQQVAFEHPEDPDAFERESAKAMAEVFAPLDQALAINPTDPELALIAQRLRGGAELTRSEEANRRRTVRRQRDQAAAAQAFADAADVSLTDAQAQAYQAGRAAAAPPPAEPPAPIIARPSAMELVAGVNRMDNPDVDAMVRAQPESPPVDPVAPLLADWTRRAVQLGPREAFTFMGVEYPPDPSRSASKTPAELEAAARAARASLVARYEVGALEARGTGDEQQAYAESFRQRRQGGTDPLLAGLPQDVVEDIETDLAQRAGRTLTQEGVQRSERQQGLNQLVVLVNAGGQLTPEQIAEGDRLAAELDDEGAAQIWDNAKTISRTGRRMVSDIMLSSTRGNSIPNTIWFGGGGGGGSVFGGGGGGGRRRRRGGGGDDDEMSGTVIPRPAGAEPGTPEYVAWVNASQGASTDPVRFFYRNDVAVPALDLRGFNTRTDRAVIASTGQGLRARAATMQQLAAQTGVPFRVFSNGERAGLQSLVEQDPANAVWISQVVTRALGPQLGQQALNELGLTEAAGVAARAQANGLNSRSATDMVRRPEGAQLAAGQQGQIDTVFASYALAAQYSPGLQQQLPALRAAATNLMLAANARGEQMSAATAFQTAAGSVRRNGVDYGGLTNVNGVATLAPTWIRRDRFDDAWAAIAPNLADNVTFADGRAPSARQMRQTVLIALGGDRYQIGIVQRGRVVGVMMQADAPGQPMVLDFSEGTARESVRRINPNWVF